MMTGERAHPGLLGAVGSCRHTRLTSHSVKRPATTQVADAVTSGSVSRAGVGGDVLPTYVHTHLRPEGGSPQFHERC